MAGKWAWMGGEGSLSSPPVAPGSVGEGGTPYTTLPGLQDKADLEDTHHQMVHYLLPTLLHYTLSTQTPEVVT